MINSLKCCSDAMDFRNISEEIPSGPTERENASSGQNTRLAINPVAVIFPSSRRKNERGSNVI
jgi:hypothetical protein